MTTHRRSHALAGIRVAGLFLTAALALPAQTAAPAFEAASVKPMPAGRGGRRGGPGTSSPGTFSQQSTLRVLMATAYGVEIDQISGPNWINSAFYAVDARVPDGATREQFQLMYQALLADRFQMKVHHETQPAEGYDLVINKSGFKLKEIPPDAPLPPGSQPGSGGQFGPDGAVITYERMPFSAFTGDLNFRLKQAGFGKSGIVHVTDKTGITGLYSFTLRFVRPGDDLPGNDFFGALESQLGLKLVPVKITIDTIVIDHAEQTPKEN